MFSKRNDKDNDMKINNKIALLSMLMFANGLVMAMDANGTSTVDADAAKPGRIAQFFSGVKTTPQYLYGKTLSAASCAGRSAVEPFFGDYEKSVLNENDVEYTTYKFTPSYKKIGATGLAVSMLAYANRGHLLSAFTKGKSFATNRNLNIAAGTILAGLVAKHFTPKAWTATTESLTSVINYLKTDERRNYTQFFTCNRYGNETTASTLTPVVAQKSWLNKITLGFMGSADITKAESTSAANVLKDGKKVGTGAGAGAGNVSDAGEDAEAGEEAGEDATGTTTGTATEEGKASTTV